MIMDSMLSYPQNPRSEMDPINISGTFQMIFVLFKSDTMPLSTRKTLAIELLNEVLCKLLSQMPSEMPKVKVVPK